MGVLVEVFCFIEKYTNVILTITLQETSVVITIKLLSIGYSTT
jgi:hypothetical protein